MTYVYRAVTEHVHQAVMAEPAGTRACTGVILHCTASPDVEYWRRHGSKATAQAIYNGHSARGWGGIGYHILIMPDGVVVFTRPFELVGCHARSWNHGTIGVAMVGCFDVGKDGLRAEQCRATGQVLYALGRKYRMELNHDICDTDQHGLGFHRHEPHARSDGKTCPGSAITKRLVREWIAQADQAAGQPKEQRMAGNLTWQTPVGDLPCRVIDGETWVGVRDLSEAFGCELEISSGYWHASFGIFPCQLFGDRYLTRLRPLAAARGWTVEICDAGIISRDTVG